MGLQNKTTIKIYFSSEKKLLCSLANYAILSSSRFFSHLSRSLFYFLYLKKKRADKVLKFQSKFKALVHIYKNFKVFRHQKYRMFTDETMGRCACCLKNQPKMLAMIYLFNSNEPTVNNFESHMHFDGSTCYTVTNLSWNSFLKHRFCCKIRLCSEIVAQFRFNKFKIIRHFQRHFTGDVTNISDKNLLP